MSDPQGVLKTVFGYDSFRPLQREVIESVLRKRDTLAVMPTGGGKSLCYQIPALIFEGLTVVVSPLIALMKDQVEQMRAAGVPALLLNSTLSNESYRENMRQIRQGRPRLLYVAPETLVAPRILALLNEVPIDCITIDEAHCISEWGHDFRPEYRQLAEVRQQFPGAVCLAMTATATPRVRQDISRSLGFDGAGEYVASFDRANLFIEVVPKTDPARQLVRFLEKFKDQSGIVYCFSRRQVDELSEYLQGCGYSARPYHAGLADAVRHANQEAFIRDDAQIMVATIAFGMGINKPNVRFVVHYDLPKSIEGYYQEIGRAGRDGLPARCLLLYRYGDAAKLKYIIDQKEGEERQVAARHLQAIVRYAQDGVNCRRRPLLSYFGERGMAERCGNCDNCTTPAGGRMAAVPVTAKVCRPAPRATIPGETAAVPEYDMALFTRLRARRKALADAANVPPYVVFSDRTLIGMAAAMPRTRSELLGISGVGQVKLEQYGDAFLAEIAAFGGGEYHPAPTTMADGTAVTADTPPADAPPASLAMRSVLIGKAWNAGETMESLMVRHRIKVATVLDHLTAYVAAGNRLANVAALRALVAVPPDDQETVRHAFAELGTRRLKPVFDRLDGRVGYEQLRILRLCTPQVDC